MTNVGHVFICLLLLFSFACSEQIDVDSPTPCSGEAESYIANNQIILPDGLVLADFPTDTGTVPSIVSGGTVESGTWIPGEGPVILELVIPGSMIKRTVSWDIADILVSFLIIHGNTAEEYRLAHTGSGVFRTNVQFSAGTNFFCGLVRVNNSNAAVSVFKTEFYKANKPPPKTWTVAFETGGFGELPSRIVAHGDSVTRPTDPVRTGWFFGGWYRDPDGSTAWNFASDTVTTDLVLYARWNDPMVGHALFRSTEGSGVPLDTLLPWSGVKVDGSDVLVTFLPIRTYRMAFGDGPSNWRMNQPVVEATWLNALDGEAGSAATRETWCVAYPGAAAVFQGGYQTIDIWSTAAVRMVQTGTGIWQIRIPRQAYTNVAVPWGDPSYFICKFIVFNETNFTGIEPCYAVTGWGVNCVVPLAEIPGWP